MLGLFRVVRKKNFMLPQQIPKNLSKLFKSFLRVTTILRVGKLATPTNKNNYQTPSRIATRLFKGLKSEMDCYPICAEKTSS